MPDAVIVGAGVGGLACAVALAQRGWSVEVLERAPGLEPVGAGIQVTPNGFAVLDALRLGGGARGLSVAAEAVEPHDALTGRRLARFDLRGAGPYRFLHRAGLVGLLWAEAEAQGVRVRMGTTVRSVDGPVAARLLVGADGVRSVVRGALNGPAPPAAFSGQVAWRAVVDAGDHPPVARIWMAPGRHVVTYPLPGVPGIAGVGAPRLNVVAVQERRAWAAEGWDHPDDPAALRAAFADAAPALAAVLARVEDVRLWGLHLHPVAPRWQDTDAQGRARALLGDAAHPTLPFLAQGANLALEDAWVLAREAAAGTLPRYQALRQARVERALAVARSNARGYHLRGPRRVLAHAGLRLLDAVAPGLMLRRLGWLYGFDATAVG